MYEQIIDGIKNEIVRLGDSRDRSVAGLRKIEDEAGNSIGFSVHSPDDALSFSDVDVLVTAIVNFGSAFSEETNWILIPKTWLAKLKDAIANTANSFENLNNNIASIDSQHGGIASVKPENYLVTTKSGTVVELAKIINNIAENLDEVLEAYYTLRPAISAPRFSEFGNLFGIFARRRDDLDKVAKEIAAIDRQGKAILSGLNDTSGAAKADQNETSRLRVEAEKDRKSLSEYANEASQKLETVRTTHKGAEELAATISNYQNSFKQFQEQLDVRNTTYDGQRNSFDALNKDMTLKQTEIGRLIELAEGMLKGATNAGLAGSYSEKRQEVDRELKKRGLRIIQALDCWFF